MDSIVLIRIPRLHPRRYSVLCANAALVIAYPDPWAAAGTIP